MQNEMEYQCCLTFDEFDELETALCVVEDAVHKAEVLNDEVLHKHLSTSILDPDNQSENIRTSTMLTCMAYNTWRTMLECVSDALERTKAALEDVNTVLYKNE